eukprot:4895211-Amphidinium_carterae.2
MAVQSGHAPNRPSGSNECCGCQSRHGSLRQCALRSHQVCPLCVIHSADSGVSAPHGVSRFTNTVSS